ncbi:hypothetical protein SEA_BOBBYDAZZLER_45 [Rhodococcus phage BobbyDazzler]|uniref:Uncharacterized protein n=2 Tax=Rerduovirus TaxID=1982375 RepID=A0A7T0M330_9CAUD|nr:hypothetical protein HWB24_gp27 [Rhodococcus phage Hiro]YP_010060257.1 hypothetical protein KIJ60_gp25 [Rhodococcus phage PhailMary]AOT23613.1 hypothetical protein SEA_HARLEQUIN_44 [Rhodococcus phage Harlequin]AOZ62800.1 hypothetical protein SEA_YOGI_44 [Rhodococcus phage Yogi]AQP30972.1 hypothetical protein SEA_BOBBYDAZZLER_45 [Rhodococcus phage BobbyDazzler]ASJ78847.1 hypothetical protein SEA_JESTER_44 [Rhodococcus phage Jester]ASR77079.1 hypothetical protein SEA_BONANZA_45 [Rhodococcus 
MNDAINPDVYQGFSNGAQMIDITENLNGNGAQAVQYIGRSTRLDGVVKGDPIEDLTKAKWFVERELQRQLATRTPRPRVWDRWEDVPEGTQITDAAGEAWYRNTPTFDEVPGPFTEILRGARA